jgi:hypothetical protein
MTEDKALDLALEALSSIDIYLSDTLSGRVNPEPATYKQWLIDGIIEARNRSRAPITAIKQARALDRKAENARELGLDYEPIAQDVQEKCRIEAVPAKGGLLPAAPVQEPPPECQTEAEKRAYAFGWWKALEANRAAPVPERNFCERCGKRLGDYIHTCTPPATKELNT